MMRKRSKYNRVSLILTLILILAFSGCGQANESTQTARPTMAVTSTTTQTAQPSPTAAALDETGRYTTPKDVAAYLHVYHLLNLWEWDKELHYRTDGRPVTADKKLMLLFDFSKPELCAG